MDQLNCSHAKVWWVNSIVLPKIDKLPVSLSVAQLSISEQETFLLKKNNVIDFFEQFFIHEIIELKNYFFFRPGILKLYLIQWEK